MVVESLEVEKKLKLGEVLCDGYVKLVRTTPSTIRGDMGAGGGRTSEMLAVGNSEFGLVQTREPASLDLKCSRHDGNLGTFYLPR